MPGRRRTWTGCCGPSAAPQKSVGATTVVSPGARGSPRSAAWNGRCFAQAHAKTATAGFSRRGLGAGGRGDGGRLQLDGAARDRRWEPRARRVQHRPGLRLSGQRRLLRSLPCHDRHATTVDPCVHGLLSCATGRLFLRGPRLHQRRADPGSVVRPPARRLQQRPQVLQCLPWRPPRRRLADLQPAGLHGRGGRDRHLDVPAVSVSPRARPDAQGAGGVVRAVLRRRAW